MALDSAGVVNALTLNTSTADSAPISLAERRRTRREIRGVRLNVEVSHDINSPHQGAIEMTAGKVRWLFPIVKSKTVLLATKFRGTDVFPEIFATDAFEQFFETVGNLQHFDI